MAAKTRVNNRLRRALLGGAVSATAGTLYAMTNVETHEQEITVWFLDDRFLFVGPYALPIALFFAAAMVRLIRCVHRLSVVSILWLASCSLVAWYVAPRMTIVVVSWLSEVQGIPSWFVRFLCGVPGGAVGALLVAGSAAVVSRPLRSPRAVFCATGIGAAAGVLVGILSDWALTMAPLFFTWQAGVLMVFAVFLGRGSVPPRGGSEPV